MSGDTKSNHWVRRRGYSKVHVKSWTIYLEKNGYVKCPFQNCNFMAFDVEEMYQHYSICNGDSSFAKFVCSICQGRTVTAEKLKNHKLKAHDVAEIESDDMDSIDHDESSNDDTNDSTIKKAALSKVVILSWKCSLEENKYIKCPECDYLERDVSAMVNHYLDCKKDSVIACYVCPECKGKAISFDILQCHMSYAHKVDISKMNFNKISPRTVQIWYDEIAHNKFARCLHKSQGVVDCLYFDTDISGIILHYQACTGAESSVGPRHTCPTCKHWTDSEEKIKVHIESCHISSITFVSRLIENNTTRNSKNLDINNCNKSKIPLRDFKVKPLGKSVNAEATVGKSMFIRKEEETVRRKSTEDVMCRRNSREQESNILKDSIGYNLYDDVEVIDITDGKTDLNEDVEFVSADSKQSEQPLIDLPPNVSDDASITYCLNKEEGTFLHCGVVNPPTRGDWTSRYKDAFRGVSISLVETKPVESTTNVQSVVCSESKKKDLSSPPKLGITKLPKSPQNTTQSVDQNKSNDNVKPDNADINTLVLSEAVEVSDTEGKGNSRVDEKSSKSIVNHSLNSSGKVRAECRQESYRDEDRSHSVEIIDVKNHESEVEQKEKEDTVCNYMVEVCNEDVNKGVLCFKITDLEESRSTVDPVADESVYVVSANLTDTKDVQNTTAADDRNKVVNDSSKSCTLSSTDSVNRETQEVASSSVGNNCPVVTSSGSHDDDEPPRIVQFFKKGRLSNTSSASEEKKVVCIEYKKGALFRSRLCRTKCKPVFDDKKPSCSGIERIERKHHSCLNATGEASSSKLISDTNRDAVETTSSVGIQMDTSRVVCETATSVGVQINDNEPELLPEKDALDIVKGNDTQEVKSGNSGSTKVIHDKVVKGDVEESTASERILDNRETTSNADEVAVGTVHKNSNKDKNKDEQKNESDPDNTSIMKAAQLHNPLKSKSSDLESDVKCSSEHYMDTSSKRVNTMKEATIIEKQNNNTEEEVYKKKADICLEEYSGKDEKNKGETAASERFLKNEEANAPKRVKHVGVRVSLGVQIKEMSEAKLRKMKKPIKNLVRKFCKEELRKYRSCKKYFHSKKPIKNFGKRIKYEKDTVREEKLSASLTSKIVGDKDELCRNLSVMDSGHQKPEDTCVSRRKTEEVMDKGNDLNSIDVHTEEREAKVIDTVKELALQRAKEAFDSGDDSDNASVSVDRDSELEPTKRTFVVQTQTFCKIQPAGVDSSQPQDDNQLTENLADKKDTITSKIIVYDTTDPVNTECDRESANCVPCKELNSNTSLKKYVGKKDEITDVKDAQISQSSAKKVDKCLTKDEMKEISTVENSSGTCEEQESSTSKNVKPVLNELKTAEESDSGEQVKTSAPPKQYLIKKAEVKEYRKRSGISSGRKCLLTEGQDKTAKCEDDSTLCLVGNVDHSVLSAHTSGESKFLSNSKREEISMDSAQIEEPEMNLVRKVKYVDELEANYSSKKIIVHDVDNDNDNEEILIYLTEDAECNASDNVDGDRNKESDESTKKTESSESMQTDGKPSEECEQPASTVTPPSNSVTPVKRRRGRPSKQEMLQRQLNQSVATDTPSHVVDNALASSTPNTQSRLRIRTCISRRYLEDYSPPFSYSERKKRSRNRHVWYMTPETSNDSTDSSQPSSKRGKNLRTGKGSSSEDECRNEEIYKEHSEKINSDGKNERGSNKDEKSVAEGESKRIEQSNLNDTSVSSEATPVKRKRGRPRKNVNVSSDLSQNNTVKELALQRAKEALDSGDDGDNASVSVGGDSESEPPKRRPVIKTETFCNIQFGEIDSNPPQDDNTLALHEIVKCGKCGEEMPRKKYLREHKMKHYNLCWLEGEQPIDFSNQDEVVNLLLRAQKKFRMKTAFKCETCGVSKKSAAGYQSHLVFCGKSKEERDALMESCPVCGRIMMPSSLKVHMHNAHSNKLVSTNEEMVQEEEIQNFVRGKRAAATKAESALQDSLGDVDDIEVTQKKRSRSPIDDIARQLYKRPAHNTNPYQIGKWRRMIAERGFGACYFPMCTFQSNDIEALRDHSKSCTHSPPKIYSCRMCEFDSIEETAMVAHVREKHEKRVLAASHSVNSEVSSSEDEDGNELTIMSHRTTPFMSKYPKLKFVRDMGKVYGSRFFHHALRITYDMREENYSKGILFNGLKPNPSEWTSMEDDEIEKYLPKTRTSVRLVTKNVEWHQIQLFESDFIDGVLTLFAGGPVWAAAWAPVCDLESQQYLAVACHPDMDLEHAMGRTYTYKSLIQIWKFDHLDNTKSDVTKPKLIYGIAHDHGAVWTLEWCPSGCYQDDRIGIFVAACSDGFIYIYSVPREDADGSCKICKPKPSAVLNLGSEMIAQCTRLSWHKVKPHSVIAAGFASGMVGVWDLNTNSPLLRCDNMYYPFHVFQPHQSSVSGLCFGPSVDPQYLATASVDCSHKFWDLRDTTAPVAIHRKGCVTDMVWMQNWLSTVNAYDEVYGYAMSSVLLNAYRDFCYQPCSLLPQTGVTWSLSCNDWINGIACGDETGRVVISLPWQIAHIDEKKVKKNSKLALLNTLHDFGEIQEVKLPQDEEENSDIHMKEQKEGSSASNQPEDAATFLTYNEAVARYGLSLTVDKQGLGIDQLQNKPKNPLSNPNMYPLTSVTKVSWNTNFRSFLYLAAGFHCGIVVIPRTPYVRSGDLVSLYRRKGGMK